MEKKNLEKPNVDVEKYAENYSPESFMDKCKNFAKKAGIKVIYLGLLLYYALQSSNPPAWCKTTILGALGYFISPIDLIPDAIPFAGFADDYGILLWAVGVMAAHISPEDKKQAKEKLSSWFSSYNESEIDGLV